MLWKSLFHVPRELNVNSLLVHEILGWIVPLNRCSVSLVKYQMQHSNKSCKCHQLIVTACPLIYLTTASSLEHKQIEQINTHNYSSFRNYVFMIRKIIISRNVHTNRSVSVSLMTSSQHNDRTHYSDLSQMMMIIVTMKWSGNLRKLFVTGVMTVTLATSVTPSLSPESRWHCQGLSAKNQTGN